MKQLRIRKILYIILVFILGFLFGLYYSNKDLKYWNVKLKKDKINNSLFYPEIERFSPLIFIGGWPRSGTTLMRTLLDVNEEVRCGPETRVIPKILEMYSDILKNKLVLQRAFISIPNLQAATTAFILEIVRRNGAPANRLCSKDPMTFIYLPLVGDLFPNAKFICMVRDGRAVTHSIFKRAIKISNVNYSDPWNIIRHWNFGVRTMYDDCMQLGLNRCIVIKYENIVLQPRKWINYVVDFLNIPRDKKMYDHWKYLKSEKVLLNSFERSTDQVINPISSKTAYEWLKDNVLSKEFITTAHLKAPTLRILEYDITKLPPDYGAPENYTD